MDIKTLSQNTKSEAKRSEAKRSKAKQSSTHTLKNSFIIPQEVGIHPKKKIPRNILRKGKDKISL